jgi:uncharacterized protein YdeI (YjbR/CyaY-like superfamily)
MKFTSAKEIATKAATIKAYVREAVAAEKAGTHHVRPSGLNAINGPKPLRLRAVCGLPLVNAANAQFAAHH